MDLILQMNTLTTKIDPIMNGTPIIRKHAKMDSSNRPKHPSI